MKNLSWIAPVALVAISVLRMGWLSMGSETMLWTPDQVGLWMPLYEAVREAFLRHHMPYWNAWAFSGLPLQENVQAAPFYWLHWLFYGVSLVTAQELILTLHECLAALFTYAWARKMGLPPLAAFTTAGAFTWSRVMTRQTTTLPHLECITWLPFCLWMWEEARTRRVAWLGVVGGFAMMMLCGSMQVPLIIAVGWLGLVVAPQAFERRGSAPGRLAFTPYRLLRTTLQTVGCGAMALGLTAGFWLPAALLLRNNVRTLMPAGDFASSEAFGPGSLLGLLFPAVGGDALWNLGNVLTFLALGSFVFRLPGSPRYRYWGVAVVALLFGMGSQGGLLPLLCRVFPPAALVRTSGRFMVLAALGLAMLAGQTVAAVSARFPDRRNLAVAMALLVVLELGILDRPLLQPRAAMQVPECLQALQDDGLYRFGMVFPRTPDRDINYLNWGTMIHRSNVAGFDAACTWPYLEALWYVDHDSPVPPGWWQTLGAHDNMVNLRTWSSPLIRLLNTRYGYGFKGWEAVASPLPRYWVVHTTHIEPDHHRLYTLLRQPGLPLQREAWQFDGQPIHSGGRFGAVEVLSEEDGNIRLHVSTDADGVLVASQPYYPGWQASVDGTATPTFPVDGMLTALHLPRGGHDVVVRYVPPSGPAPDISAVSGVLILLWGVWLAWRSR